MLRRQETRSALPSRPGRPRFDRHPAPQTKADFGFPYQVRRKSTNPSKAGSEECVPVWYRLKLGVCVGLNEYIERITHKSSITEAQYSAQYRSLQSRSCPYFLKREVEGIKPPVCRSVRRSTEPGRWPLILHQHRFRVKHIHMRRSARKEQADDMLCFTRRARCRHSGRVLLLAPWTTRPASQPAQPSPSSPNTTLNHFTS